MNAQIQFLLKKKGGDEMIIMGDCLDTQFVSALKPALLRLIYKP